MSPRVFLSREIITDTTIPNSARVTYALLTLLADDRGEVSSSYSRLAAESGLNARTIAESLRQLSKAGYLHIEAHPPGLSLYRLTDGRPTTAQEIA